MGHPEKTLDPWAGIDPVCGMEVNERSQYATHFEGVEYHFCSKHCQEKFAADPPSYLNEPEIGKAAEHPQGK
ncbi:TPA: YHS domain-containing protein, partial [Candidatus Micrarchaeota archaeon]|nr:YHS domain-containing protein [Candidatus Micrarchaeota archaeon]